MHCTNLCRSACGLAAALLFGAAAASAAPTRLSADDLAFERAAKGVAQGQKLVVEGLLLEGARGTSTLDLERIEVWRPDATVLVDQERVAVPKSVYFRGTIDGDPASAVLLSVRERGGVMGMVFRGDAAWAIGKGRGQGALRSQRARTEELKKPFECALGELPAAERRIEFAGAPAAESPSTVPDQPYDATIAIDTDFEYYSKFTGQADPQAAALDYMGDLVGYADLVYSREIDTDMFIGFARLWTTSADPWSATTSSNALYEFRDYWNANMQSTPRTVAHMLSGRETGGGVAWLSVLCDWYGNPGNNLSYGYSGTLDANFSWDGNQAHNPATVVWDIMVVMHEIGHNFSSPHTHDYCGYGGSSEPIDRCYQGCAGAAQGLPSCSSPTPFFNGGAGTIMSYCHLVGGMNAIALSFGEGHTCGTLPGREANQMSAHVVSRNSLYPTCFVSSTCGNGTLDEGEQCDQGNLNGASCASLGFVGGTLACSSTCTYDTSGCHDCGNDVIDTGEVCDGADLGGKSCGDFACTGGGTLGCNATCDGYDKSLCLDCPPCDDDGTCEAGEDCVGCPGDCPSGTTSGAVCGNGVCEAGNGEDCLSCPSDCRGVQGGKPSSRYCCGDGAGTNPVTCADARCTSNGWSCTTVPTAPGDYCCGDDLCESGESCASCALDCTLGAEVCGNGADDDCNGQTDCADAACSSTPSCLCEPTGSPCASGSECCSGTCRTKGKNANTCA
jgi:hypothetical protein